MIRCTTMGLTGCGISVPDVHLAGLPAELGPTQFQMKQPSFDPGLTQQYGDRLRRSINPDGSFNVKRRGTLLRHVNIYVDLINMSWPRFIAVVVSGYFAANMLFALTYLWIGIDHLKG